MQFSYHKRDLNDLFYFCKCNNKHKSEKKMKSKQKKQKYNVHRK